MAFLKPCHAAAGLLWRAVLLAWLCCAGTARADEVLARQVKAAYLYKFAGYVEWPDGALPRPDSPVVIGVAHDGALADQLEHMVAGRTANGHPLQVRRLRRGDALAGLHMLFIGTPSGELMAAVRGLPVLTVTDSTDAFALGSMINFLVADDRLRFEVALKPAIQAHLRISARMLTAATRVLQREGLP